MSFKPVTVLVIFTLIPITAALGQQGNWARADDPTAKFIIDAERQWAETACTHNKIAEKIVADDFQGTTPKGTRYTKSEAVVEDSSAAKDCRLLDARVRFFGEGLAMVYGRESSVRRTKNGNERTECLIWTDTWLKRNGKWQVIAAQDTEYKCK